MIVVKNKEQSKTVVTMRCSNSFCAQDWLAWDKTDDICGVCNHIGIVTGTKPIQLYPPRRKRTEERE